MNTLDFTRSYIRFRIDLQAQPAITLTHKPPTTVNNVRIVAECRCELFNRRTGISQVYLLGASCKTERVGADRDCWLLPNADFCLIASDHEFMAIKSWARNGMDVMHDADAVAAPTERQSGEMLKAFQDFSLEPFPTKGKRLQGIESIIAAIRGNRPIVARTQYDDGDWRVTIDQPVKTINYSERESVFQTDTGPLLLPDLSSDRLQKSNRLVECFDLAYSAFNSAGWTEFIINVSTPIQNGVSVNHYSRVRRIEPVQNSLIELLDQVRPLPPATSDDEAVFAGGACAATQ